MTELIDGAKVAELDEGIAMIIVQFALNKAEFIPSGIPLKEKSEEQVRVVAKSPGRLLIDTKQNVRIAEIFPTLQNKGWALRNVFYEPRTNRQQEEFYVVRGVLMRKEGIKVNPNILGREPSMWEKILKICRKSYHLRIWDNPCFWEGKETSKRTLLIECNAMQDNSGSDLVLFFKRTRLYLQKVKGQLLGHSNAVSQ